MSKTFVDLKDITEKEIIDGYHAKFVHSDSMTIANWRVEKGKAIPEHAHPHEQIACVIEGEFELCVNGETKQLKPGEFALIPSNIKHSGRAITDCKLMDIFHPVREEYKND